MKRINNYKSFLEELNNNPNPQGYLNSLSNKPKLKPNQKPNQQPTQQPTQQQTQQQTQQKTPTDEIDVILQDTEVQKQNIVAKKDAIEKGLLNNIRDLEPQNQKDVKTQVGDYRNQVQEFDKTVRQIDKLNQTLKKSNKPSSSRSYIQRSREQNKF